MVAVPKNQALTMLLGGSVGFAPAATSAQVANGEIILSSGFGYNGSGVTGGTQGSGAINIGSSGAASLSHRTSSPMPTEASRSPQPPPTSHFPAMSRSKTISQLALGM